jgi:hypothetical protein
MKGDHFQYFYLKALERMFNLRDMILIYPIERLALADNRYYRMTWFDSIKNNLRESHCMNVDMMDYPHLIQGLPISFPDELDEYPPASEVEETNSEREENSEKKASPAPN